MKAYPRFVSRLALLVAALPLSSVFTYAQPFAEQVPTTVVGPNNNTVVPMEELVAPIALYPDALIALILPASAASSDVVLAARFLNTGGTPEQVDSQPWDDSVKGLSHYPDVIKWMDENLAWTQRIGEAYVDQPEAVMNAIQRARTIARNNGVLIDTPQQQVVMEDSYIRIIPAQPEVIYVPRYDPEIIYVQRPTYYSPDPWLTFGIGFGVGSWLAYDLDWGRHAIWVDHHRHEHWRQHHDWRYRSSPGRGGFVGRDPYWRQWQPLPGRTRPLHRDWDRRGHDFVRPSPLPGAPHFDRDRWQDRSHNRPDRYVGGSRPGVREAWDRSEDQRSRVNHSSGSMRRPSGNNNWANNQTSDTNNVVTNQTAIVPSAPASAVAPTPVNPVPERRRGSFDNDGRQGGSRPGVREAWDRSADQRSRVNQSSGSMRRPSGTNNWANNQPSATNNVVTNQTAIVPSAPAAAVAPTPVNPNQERQRGSFDNDRRQGIRNGERRNGGGGTVSVVPSERRQQPAGNEVQAMPRVNGEGERRRGPIDRPERSIRPAMPNLRSQSMAPQPAIAAAPVPQAAAPVQRSAPPTMREYRQPDRVAQPAAAPAQVRSAPPQIRESQAGERGSRAVMSDRGNGGGGGGGRGEGRGGGRDRQQEH